MFSSILIAQSSGSKTKKEYHEVSTSTQQIPPLLVITSGGLTFAVIALIVYSKILINKLEKKNKFEQFRARELEKKFKLALETIRKMETNPDLVNSRDFNLDYLRMRMSEEVFHFAVINQIKIQVKEKFLKLCVLVKPNKVQ